MLISLQTLALSSIHSLSTLSPLAIVAALGAFAYGVGGLAFVRHLQNGNAHTAPKSVNTATPTPVYRSAA